MQACYSPPCRADTLGSRDKSTLMRAALTDRSSEERECRVICYETLKELALAASNSPSALACGTPMLAGPTIAGCPDQTLQPPEHGLESVERIVQPRKFVDLVRRQSSA